MVTCDYIVATYSTGDNVDALLPYLYYVGGVNDGSKKLNLYGARARKGAYAVVGEFADGGLLIQSSGGVAHEVALALRTVAVDKRSVARCDLQVTFEVAGADEIIVDLRHSSRYNATLIRSLSGRGATLYVGAPSSSARLRAYNKTAESGVPAPGGGELLRVELQTRDRYADAAYRALIAGAQDDYLLHWLRKMIRSVEFCNKVSATLSSGGDYRLPEVGDDADWIARRKRWFETCVVPALQRLIAADPAYMDVLLSLVEGLPQVGDNQPEAAKSQQKES